MPPDSSHFVQVGSSLPLEMSIWTLASPHFRQPNMKGLSRPPGWQGEGKGEVFWRFLTGEGEELLLLLSSIKSSWDSGSEGVLIDVGEDIGRGLKSL